MQPNSDQAFAAGLARLIADEDLRFVMGQRAREFVTQNYSKDRLLGDVSTLYQELMHNASFHLPHSSSNRSLASRV